MRVLFYPAVEQVERRELRTAHVVVIDVLRTASTVVAALENGARKIIPVEDIETASRLARPSDRSAKILGGERSGIRIEGFDLGNSPLEYTAEAVGNRTVILTTTNGTRGIAAASKASRVALCSINNVGAVAFWARSAPRLAVVCCGTEGGLAAEDLLCGGMLLDAIGGRIVPEIPGDAARLALLLARENGDAAEPLLRSCDSGKKLIAMGREADVAHCARRDVSAIVPEIKQGAIVAAG